MLRINLLLFILLLLVSVSFAAAPVITVSGPLVRIPGMLTPTQLQVSGYSSTVRSVRWLRNGVYFGDGATIPVTESGTYAAQGDFGPDPDIPQWSTIKTYVLNLPFFSHGINISDVLRPGASINLFTSGNGDDYRISSRWFRNGIEQSTVPSGSHTHSTNRPGTYVAQVTYRFGTEQVVVSTGQVTVAASTQSPLVNYSKTISDPVSARVVLTVNNFSTFSRVLVYRDETLLTEMNMSTSELPGPGTYYVKGFVTAGEVYSIDQVITSGSVSSPWNHKVNYVNQRMIKREGVQQPSELAGLGSSEVKENTTYFDGLVRPLQVVAKGLSPQGKDVVQFHTYDDASREQRSYLPFVRNTTDGKYRYISGANPGDIYQFYQQTNDGIANTAYPFGETVYESSVLNRVKEQGSAGENWRKGSGHTVLMGYGSNTTTDTILCWKKTSSGFTAATTYPAGTLLVNEVTDNNGRQSREFTNKEGNKILTERPGDNGTRLRTYSIYNELNQLVGILPPQPVQTAGTTLPVTISSVIADKESYQYSYDTRGRMVSKRIPGSATVFMVYDPWDRVVLSQDGNQRTTQKWTFTKYDAFDRAIMIGEVVLSGDQSAQQTAVNNFYLSVATNLALRYETIGTAQHGYTNRSFPILPGTAEVNIVTYYDDYKFLTNLPAGRYAFLADASLGLSNYFPRTSGLRTGIKTRILGSTQYLTSVTYYNKRYQVIQALSDNVWNNVDCMSSQYDFIGKLIKGKQVHAGAETVTQVTEFEYDHADRLLRSYHQVNGGSRVLVSEQQYNELGQLIGKELHKENGQNPFQRLDYEYNIRGWVTGVNKTASQPGTRYTDLYSFALSYDEPVSGLTTTAQYNGNISSFSESRPTEEDATGIYRSAYTYQYDTRDQLKESKYFQTSNPLKNGRYNELLSYDANGNITNLHRQGVNSSGASQEIDNLQYIYEGNRLKNITDGGSATLGFKDQSSTNNTDYTYDANGNLKSDYNKGISLITYNNLNLVNEVTFSDNRKVKYTYSASGEKLSQESYGSNNQLKQVRKYSRGIIYKSNTQQSDTLQEIQHAEGRIVHRTLGQSNSPWVYEYYMKDHLGNVRLSFTTREETQSSTATLESSKATTEQSNFFNYEEAVKVNSVLFDHTKKGTTQYATRLNGSEKEKYGLAKSISVMAGDKIKAEVFAKYVDTNKSNWTSALTNLISSIAMGTAPAGTVIDGGSAGSSGSENFPLAGLLDKSSETGNEPKAYLNYVVFDRNYNLVDGGYVKLSEQAREYGQNGTHEWLYKEITIKTSGYVYVYLSNESAGSSKPVEVYFDDFTIEQLMSPVKETTAYYAFGLTTEQQSREGQIDQRFKYNGKEQQGEGLDWYDYGARMYDAAIGRWSVIDPLAEKEPSLSPYNYVGNNPILFIDPDGRLRIKNGVVEFERNGRPEPFTQHDTGESTIALRGYLKADDGSKIEAYRDMEGDRRWTSNCHGSTFAKGQIWINNDQVDKILVGDNYKRLVVKDEIKPGDVVIFRDKDGGVVHSVTVVSIETDGTVMVSGQGGLDIEDKEVKLNEAWSGPASRSFYRKDNPKKEEGGISPEVMIYLYNEARELFREIQVAEKAREKARKNAMAEKSKK